MQWVGWRMQVPTGKIAKMACYIKFVGAIPDRTDNFGMKFQGQLHNEWVDKTRLRPDHWHHVTATSTTTLGGDGNHFLLIFDSVPGPAQIQIGGLRLEIFDSLPAATGYVCHPGPCVTPPPPAPPLIPPSPPEGEGEEDEGEGGGGEAGGEDGDEGVGGAEEPPAPPGPPMDGTTRSGLNMYCGKWRDGENELKKTQLKNMVKCMQQDCVQSMEEIRCDYLTPTSGGTDKATLCYTNPGQLFCKQNPTSVDCKNVATWVPVVNVPFRGSFKDQKQKSKKVTNEMDFSCVCAKKCSYWSTQNSLRCADGWEMVGNPLDSPFQRENLKQSKGDRGVTHDSGKAEECACVCGSVFDNKWTFA